MVIQVYTNPPSVTVNNLRIEIAPPIGELLNVIGTPSRVDTGPNPAPTGFRNNQQHVFDALGIHVNEHHHTRRAQAIGICLSVDEIRYGFTPKMPFAGQLLFDGVSMPLRPTEREFLEAAPWSFAQPIAGIGHHQFDGYSVVFEALGRRNGSRQRSKNRIVAAISISWPHDPNGPPAIS